MTLLLAGTTIYSCLYPLHANAAEPASPTLVPPSSSTYDAFTQFARFLEVVLKNYVDPTRLDQLNTASTGALRAFLRSLDPEAELLPPPDREAAPEANVRFGALLGHDGEYPVIVAPLDGTPAQRAGLLPGERIAAVNDEPVGPLSLSAVRHNLDGPAGSQLILRVLDPAAGTRNIVVERKSTPVAANTFSKILPERVGYLRLPEFSFSVVEQFHAQLDRLCQEHVRSLILDLRNNPGGAIQATVVAASIFLPATTEIVTMTYPQTYKNAPFVSSNPQPLTLTVVVLVNEGTAAEAEVFAAALQAHGSARLVGITTAGRGRVNGTFPLPDGSQVVLPAAYYVTPAKKRIQTLGITPDVIVKLSRDTERMLSAVGYASFDWSRNPQKVLEIDRQLAKAIELLKK